MPEPQIRITVEDLLTGDREVVEIADNYLLICAGRCELTYTNVYPMKGTHVLTIKNASGLVSKVTPDA